MKMASKMAAKDIVRSKFRCHLHAVCVLFVNTYLSYDIASESEITPCNKIDKPQLVYRFTGNGKRYDVHNNVTYIMTKV